jgi:replicative DNA helicase
MESRSAIERALVCAAFSSADCVDQIAARCTAQDFSRPDMRAVWNALQSLAEANSALDPVLVLEHLDGRHGIPQGIALEMLVELSSASWEASHIEHYCDVLLKHAATDDAHQLGERLSKEPMVDERLIDEYITKLDQIQRGRKDEIKTAADAVKGLQERKANPLVIHSTGIQSLDDRLRGGLRDGQVAVIGGRPGAGKSVLLTQIAVGMAERGEGALIVSLEMMKEEIADRLSKTRPVEQLSAMPLYFIDSTSDLGVICSLIRVACRRHRIGVIAIDYLQLAEVAAGRNENRERQIATISRRLKRLAMDLQKPVIVGSQLNRESTKRGKPSLADLRESGSIEQDADIVILLSKSDDGPETTIDIAKQRGGSLGEVVMRLDGPRFQFVPDGPEDYWQGRL